MKGGSAHLEIGRALRAARDRAAHLVISLKPFGCLPSSALSDGILSVLARGLPRVRFLAVETTGDADAAVESRTEMAVHAATLAAIEELDEACEGAGLSEEEARHESREIEPGRGAPGGAAYLCLHRGGAGPARPITPRTAAPTARAPVARG